MQHALTDSIDGRNANEKAPSRGKVSPKAIETDRSVMYEFIPTWKRILGVEAVTIGSPAQPFKALSSSLVLIQHPAVIWGCLMWSITFTWVIIQGAIADQVWRAPPYNLSPTAVGDLVGIAPLIGSALGCLIGGAASDWLGQSLTKSNAGVYEPEYRLLIIIPTVLTAAVGAFGLGEALAREFSLIVTAVFLAILNFAVGMGCTGIVAYTNDTCQHRAGEAFALAMIMKSAFAFGLTFMLNDYYAAKGPRIFFATWGGLTLGIMLSTLLLYILGKRMRQWSANVLRSNAS
ncbi:hypothetical protein KC338_g8116 [Hortaea werneckii]|nr:hypothetical protein KC323_g9382 [Hortaea werneckii]KAI6857323.1 hypothetical protein KC338_g8116 [Hortaea werneckii]